MILCTLGLMNVEQFPPEYPFVFEGQTVAPEQVIKALEPLLTPERQARIAEVVARRTYTIATVVEGIYDEGNVHAVLRSAEALGGQPAHIIHPEAPTRLTTGRVSRGAEKWLDVYDWDGPKACLDHLKKQGYQIAALDLEGAVPINEVDFTQPTALIFGNEKEGISETVRAAADVRVVLPMVGFVQSYNISVAAALGLYHVYTARLAQNGYHGDLSERQKTILTAAFYMRSIPTHESVVRRILCPEG